MAESVRFAHMQLKDEANKKGKKGKRTGDDNETQTRLKKRAH